jgi:GAF domain-containing protein/DNA-binding response OmpR family regulator/sensor histidine kinase YesM
MQGVSQEQTRRLQFTFGRLGTRLWVPFVLGAIVSVAIVVLLVISSINNQRAQIILPQRTSAQSLAVQSSEFVKEISDDLRIVVNPVTLPSLSQLVLDQVLSNAIRDHAALMDLALIGLNGIEIAQVARDNNTIIHLDDRSTSEEFKVAMSGQDYIGPVRAVDGVPLVTMSVPVLNDRQQVIDVVVAEVDLRGLCDIICPVNIGQQGYAYLIDEQGNLIAYRDFKSISGPVLYAPAANDAIINHGELADPQTYQASLVSSGGSTLAYYAPVLLENSTRWYIVIEQPAADAFAQLNQLIIISISLVLISLGSIVVLGFLISRRVMVPLAMLRLGATQLAQGDLDHRITGVQTGDELEFLAAEFNEMAERLKAAQGNLSNVAAERQVQFETAQQRVKEMSSLLQAGRAITSLDLESVLGNLARETAGAVSADRCSIFVYDQRQRLLALRGWWDIEGIPQPALAYTLGEGLIGWIARENRPLFLANVHTDPRFVVKWAHDNDIAAAMSVPLIMDELVVGVMQVATRPGTPAFSREDQRLLGNFSEQAAVAIKNAQLYEDERRRAQEMAVVAEINRTISSSLALDTTLDVILESIKTLIPYDLAEINLWDARDQVMRTHGRASTDPKYAEYSRTQGGVYRLDQGFTGWLANHRQPLLIEDVAAGEIVPVIDQQTFPIRSHCGVPLISGDELIGTLELASYAPGTFTASHLETVKTIAGQAAVAIQNALLFEEARHGAAESASLFRISAIAASGSSPDELLQSMMAEICTLLKAQLGVVMLFNADTRQLEPLLSTAFGDLPDTVRDFKIDTTRPSFHRSAFASHQIRRFDDAVSDRRLLPAYRALLAQYRGASLLIGPLITRDQAIGEVYIVKRGGEPFTLEDERRLSTVTALLANAIENARLYQEAQRSIEQLNYLSEIGRTMSAALNEDQVLDILYAETNRIIDARTLYVVRYEEPLDEVTFVRVYEDGVLAELGADTKLRGQNTLTFYVCRNRKPLLLRGDLNAEMERLGIQTRLIASGQPAAAWMGVPMIVGERVVGMISVQHLENRFAYDQNDVNLLQAIANSAGIALENARLYQLTDVRLSQRVEELTALSAVTQELNATLDQNNIFSLVLDEATRLTGATHGVISLIKADAQELEVRASRGFTRDAAQRIQSSRVPLGVGVVGQAAVNGKPLIVNDVRQNPNYQQINPETQAQIVVPIRYAQSVAGVLNLESPHLNAFTQEHLDFLEALASQAAIAIGNAQRLQEQMEGSQLLRSRAEQLTNLFQLGQAFRTDVPLEQIFDDVVHAIQETVGFNIVILSLLAGEPPVLRREAAAGIPVATFAEMRRVEQPWGNISEIMRDQFRISQSYYVPLESRHVTAGLDTYTPPNSDTSAQRQPGMWHPEDLLITLLRGSGDRILGIVSVDEPQSGRVPDRSTIEALELFANQAAIAVENSRLYADLQQRLDSLTLFNEVGRSISAKLDLDSLLATVLEASTQLMQAPRSTIFLRDPLDGKYVLRKAIGFDTRQIAPLRFSSGEGLAGAVVADRHGLNVPEVDQDPRFVQSPMSADVKSMLLAPLMVADQIIGVLTVDKLVPNGFTGTDLVVLSTLADQAAVAIENARLYQETQHRLGEQSLLYEAGLAISATLNYQQVLETVSSQMLRATNPQLVIIQEWDRASDKLITVHTRYQTLAGLKQSELETQAFAPLDYLRVAQFLQDRRSLSLRLNDPELDQSLKDRMTDTGLLWLLEIPIVARDEVLGLVRVGDGRLDRILTDSEIQLMETLVNQAAVAMSNARLYDQVIKFTQELEGRVEERTRELARANTDLTAERDQVETLFRITSELSASLDLDRVLNRALELVVDAVAVPYGSILLADAQKTNLRMRAVLGEKELLPPGGKTVTFRASEGVAGWSVINRQAVIVSDTRQDARGVERSDIEREFRSALAAPLIISEDVLGAVLLLHPDPNYFTESHLRLVSAAAAQVATAINNAELYRYIREQAELLGGMLRAQQVEGSKSQAILESVTDGVLVTDAGGMVILFNAAAERILSSSRGQVLSRSIYDLLGLYAAAGPQFVSQVRDWLNSAEARRKSPVLSQRMEFSTESRFVNVTLAPVTLGEEYLGSISVFRDITREVEADRAKTEFVSIVSHELRTPMTSIKGYADLMLLGAAGVVNENQHRFLSVIKSNADRLSVLVNDLLDISRIESGRVKLDIKPISIENIVEQTVAALHGRIEEKGIQLHIDLPGGELPEVQGDRDRVIQILTNLVSNAYQYTSSGGSITVRVRPILGFVQVDVTDTGIGIAPENQDKVFDRFFRVDDPNVQEFPGTGLGLAIVKSLVEMHEGQLWLESKVNEGTTFSFTLPTIQPEIEVIPVTPKEQPKELLTAVAAQLPVHVDKSGERRRILVVEDDRDIAELIRQHLTNVGYDVSIAGRAQDALKRVEAETPDLITLDIYLPDRDGFELLQDFKTNPATAHIPIVIVSVLPDEREGFRLGAVDYLTKPIDPQRLVASIHGILHGKGKVLVVDDDRATRELLQIALETRGFTVVLTASGKRALVLARQEAPNLILLDLRLPGLDGYEVLRKLKSSAETADIPVIVITGSLTDDELKHNKVLSLGAARFKTKPFAVDELLTEISDLVQGNLSQPISS